MRDLMVKSGVPAKTLYNSILTDAHFKKKLKKFELDIVDTLQTDEYNKIDTSLSYKVIRHFQRFIPPPSRQWGANPIDTEIEIGDDIERIRQERNRFVHRVNDNISEVMFDNFFVTFIEVGKRIDAYLNKTQNNGYAQTVRQYKTCVVNPELEKQILDTLKDIEQLKENYIVKTSGNKVHILIGDSVEAAIDAFREKTEEGSTNMKLIIHDVDDNEEMVKRLNLLKEDLNIEKIYSNGAEKGSIILFIDVKNRVVLDDGMFKGAPSTKNIFNFAMFTCDLYTQTYAAIASATDSLGEYEAPSGKKRT
ncbi:Hypothetical predicted protein [Mytilus galloprovincialis]|nr:Hypothetical predicted protein [Mytilus galloprovincialis]